MYKRDDVGMLIKQDLCAKTELCGDLSFLPTPAVKWRVILLVFITKSQTFPGYG